MAKTIAIRADLHTILLQSIDLFSGHNIYNVLKDKNICKSELFWGIVNQIWEQHCNEKGMDISQYPEKYI